MGTLAEIFSNFLLFFLVFGMSATVDIDKLRKQLGNRHALLTGVLLQFLILPFVGFLIVKLFKFPPAIGITLLVVTSSPGGSYSNWWCSLFNAELALSVTMTALSTCLSVVMLPVNLIIYASGSYSSAVVKSLDWYALFMSLFVVISGISSGLFVSAYFKDSPEKSHQIHKTANRFGNVAGLSLITYSILVSSSDHQAALWDQDWKFFVGIATPAVVGISIATALATRFKLEKPERVAVAVESCYQNTGIATSVAVVMFDTNKDDLATAISVPLYYGMCEAILLATYCLICWKIGWTKAPADEKLCVVLATSYEVEEEEALAQATPIEVVLGDVTRSEGGETTEVDCEKGPAYAEGGAIPKSPLVLEERTVDEGDEESTAGSSLSGGAVVLRKVDYDETAKVESSDPLAGGGSSSHERDETVIKAAQQESGKSVLSSKRRLSFRTDDTSSPSESLSDVEGEAMEQQQQLDGSGREGTSGVGRLGKTISFVKARATGYRRAPVPNYDDDGEERIRPSLRQPATGIPESGELPETGLYEDAAPPSSIVRESSPNCRKDSGSVGSRSPGRPSQDEATADATPAEGRTID